MPVVRLLGDPPEDKVRLDSLRSEDVFGLLGLRLSVGREGDDVRRQAGQCVQVGLGVHSQTLGAEIRDQIFI